LHFPNDFPQGTPAVAGLPADISLPGGKSIAVNDASNGLCGGMAFTAVDYFMAGRRPPPDRTPPEPGSPLFRHLVTRLVDSWEIPRGVLRYLELMSPAIPDAQSWWRFWATSRAKVMTRVATNLRRDIDTGRVVPLGLIRKKSWDPLDLKHHHQVVAWGYDLLRDGLTIYLYDPNEPDNDSVTMKLDPSSPSRPIAVAYDPPDPAFPVWCFFRVNFWPAPPPD